ncbi:MAG: hypothetical protein EA370_14660 [Wenzhouxiangella sp.]|nr:MAG: hypothetical protein EA370_14660 [Wenzhouxiangella sp.]
MNPLPDQAYRHLFKAMPGKVLVLRAGSLEIVAVTDAYLQATMTREADIIGKTVFEVFPDDPNDPDAQGVKNLLASLERVQSLKLTDVVGLLRYPVRRPDGQFEERFWSPVNSPVLNDTGELDFIIHRVEDVTPVVQESDLAFTSSTAHSSDPAALRDILLRSQELRQALSKVQEHETRKRTAERLLSLGAWEHINRLILV